VLTLAVLLLLPLQARAEERQIVSRAKATYPEMAKRLKITGSVLLNATVDPTGHVKTVSTVMGNGMLAEAAKEAVSKWKFAPTDHETIEEVEIAFP
jgi:TonB family protein